MSEKKMIIDTTLRDGEQSPFVHLTSQNKIDVAKHLDEIGVYQIEAGSAAIGLAEQNTLCKIIENKKNAKIAIWSRLNIMDVTSALSCQPDIVHVTIPISYSHIYTKLRKNKAWIVKEMMEILDVVANSDSDLSIGFEDASRAELSFIVKILSLAKQFKPKMARIADTVGGAPPYLLRDLVKTIMEFTDINLEIHAHNDLGMALANTVEALKMGVVYADTTLLGIGERCGNCDLQKLLKFSNNMFDFGINADAAMELEDYFKSVLMNNRCCK